MLPHFVAHIYHRIVVSGQNMAVATAQHAREKKTHIHEGCVYPQLIVTKF